jgi:Spy/CpxP family protein refolding chaperone
MLNKTTLTLVTITLVAAMAVFGSNALAGWGHSEDDDDTHGTGRMGRHHGHKGAHFEGDCGVNDLSEEQLQQVKEIKEAYFEATDELRKNIDAKRQELAKLLAEEQPDTEKAATLQKQISDLRATLDQQRLAHILKLKEIDPDLGGHFGHGRHGKHGGYGHGGGRW